jgi:hypothetical protein
MKKKLVSLLCIFGFIILFGEERVGHDKLENTEPSEYAKLLQEAEIEELVAIYVKNLVPSDFLADEILSFIRKKNKDNFIKIIDITYDEDADKLINSLFWINKDTQESDNLMEDLLDIRTTYRNIKNLPPSKQIETYIKAEVCTALWARSSPSKTNIINLLKQCILASYTEVNG